MSVPVGSHIKDKAKREAAKRKRDTCKYYTPRAGACEIRKKLICWQCNGHENRTMLIHKYVSSGNDTERLSHIS
jgi:hypothetical protein